MKENVMLLSRETAPRFVGSGFTYVKRHSLNIEPQIQLNKSSELKLE
jgi:hypothetical protein